MVGAPFLRGWMVEHGFSENLIWKDIPNSNYRAYLDPRHRHFSKKLAAAICAWEAINEDPDLLLGTTPKAAMSKWLEENREKLAIESDGIELSDTAIDDICQIANWNVKGGVAKSVAKRQKS